MSWNLARDLLLHGNIMQIFRGLMFAAVLALGYLMFFRTQGQTAPEAADAAKAPPTAAVTAAPPVRPADPYKVDMDLAKEAARLMTAEHHEADQIP